MMAGVDMVHVPYRGGASALTALLGGQVQMMFGSMAASTEYIRSGKLRALAVTTSKRLRMLPDIPTIGEFVPGYEATGFFGIGAPKNTPAAIVEKLNKEIDAGRADPKSRFGLPSWTARSFPAPRRVRQTHRRGNGEVGQGSQILRRQSGLTAVLGGRAVSTAPRCSSCRSRSNAALE